MLMASNSELDVLALEGLEALRQPQIDLTEGEVQTRQEGPLVRTAAVPADVRIGRARAVEHVVRQARTQGDDARQRKS
jgi:hypothetical protein